MKKTFVLLLLTIVLSGCALFSDQSRKHIIEDRTGAPGKEIGTLAMVAQRRVFLVKFVDGKFCAEPPPDAVDNLASALSASLSGGNKSADVSATVAASFASTAKQLFFRSQGLQLYRDGTFALCNMYLNDVIKAPEYAAKQSELLNAVISLIKDQFPYLEKNPVDPGTVPTTSKSPTPNLEKKPVDGDTVPTTPKSPTPTKTDQNQKK